jgi:peroxiredoxin
MWELQGLQLRRSDFAKRNTEILALVVDPVEQNAQVVRDLGLEYRVLADPQLAVIDAYGLRHEQGEAEPPIAHPASFLIDANGVVRWRALTANYRLRPQPETILAQIDRLETRPH